MIKKKPLLCVRNSVSRRARFDAYAAAASLPMNHLCNRQNRVLYGIAADIMAHLFVDQLSPGLLAQNDKPVAMLHSANGLIRYLWAMIALCRDEEMNLFYASLCKLFQRPLHEDDRRKAMLLYILRVPSLLPVVPGEGAFVLLGSDTAFKPNFDVYRGLIAKKGIPIHTASGENWKQQLADQIKETTKMMELPFHPSAKEGVALLAEVDVKWKLPFDLDENGPQQIFSLLGQKRVVQLLKGKAYNKGHASVTIDRFPNLQGALLPLTNHSRDHAIAMFSLQPLLGIENPIALQKQIHEIAHAILTGHIIENLDEKENWDIELPEINCSLVVDNLGEAFELSIGNFPKNIEISKRPTETPHSMPTSQRMHSKVEINAEGMYASVAYVADKGRCRGSTTGRKPLTLYPALAVHVIKLPPQLSPASVKTAKYVHFCGQIVFVG